MYLLLRLGSGASKIFISKRDLTGQPPDRPKRPGGAEVGVPQGQGANPFGEDAKGGSAQAVKPLPPVRRNGTVQRRVRRAELPERRWEESSAVPETPLGRSSSDNLPYGFDRPTFYKEHLG